MLDLTSLLRMTTSFRQPLGIQLSQSRVQKALLQLSYRSSKRAKTFACFYKLLITHSCVETLTVPSTCRRRISKRDIAIHFFFGFFIGTFAVILVSVVKFFVACSVSEILKDK